MASEVKEEKLEEKPDITTILPAADLPTIPENPVKSSMEILSELFNSFDAEPPLIIKKEKTESSSKKPKKSKKSKHKHNKDKKHKKKDKKRKRNSSSSSEPSELDLAEILIKQEKESTEKKIKIEGTDLSLTLPEIMAEIKKEKEFVNNHEPLIAKDEKKCEESTEINEEKERSAEKGKASDEADPTTSRKIKIKLKTTNLEDKNEDKSKKNRETEEGEVSDDNAEKRKKSKKRKHKESDDDHKKKKRRSEDKSIKILTNDLRNKIRAHRDDRHSRDDSFYNPPPENEFYSTRRRSEEDDEILHRRKSKEDDFYNNKRHERDDEDNGFHKGKDHHHNHHRSRSYDREKRRSDSRRREDDDFYKKEKEHHNFRYRPPHERQRDRDRRHRSPSRDSSYIDKKKLLAIARKNAIVMMKSGNLPGALNLGPQAQEKVIAAIKAGGKTIEELTDFCKTLSRKEEMGELSSGPENEDSDPDQPFHHPFQIKDRPTSITMNIKNSVPLPIKSTQERSTELRMQFPVSSGQLHRKTESEWVPVISSRKSEKPAEVQTPAIKPAVTSSASTALLAIEAPPAVTVENKDAVPGPQLFPKTGTDNSDIGSIVSQRLTAMRKLQENPNDVQALTEIYKSNKEMQSWAQSKQQPGQFTGTTGAQILTQAELSSGYQAWAKKDQLQCATPVSGGMGMHLLQKMGWKPGEGLGKEKTGALEPLLLEVKLDKKGLVANEEQKRKKKLNLGWAKSLQNKHPVSLLGEYASKKKLGAPEYTLCFECGPDHKKNFVFRVAINGVEYKPNIASPNKKEAKANAATVCLQELGLLPSTPAQPTPSK